MRDMKVVPLFPGEKPDPTSLRGRLLTPRAVKDFALSGRAHFTVVSATTGNRFTYRVSSPQNADEHERHPNRRAIWFVSALTGPDNEAHYKYIGCIRDDMRFTHGGSKAKLTYDALSVISFNWFWHNLRGENEGLMQLVEVWHEGRCGRCGRKLTVPESVESGYGPECRRLI